MAVKLYAMGQEYSRYQYWRKGSKWTLGRFGGVLKNYSGVIRCRSDNAGKKVIVMTLVLCDITDETTQGLESGDASERRRGLRIRQARPIRVFEPAGSRFFGGRTEDISTTGLRIEIPLSADLEPGDLLSVHVGLNRDGSILANRRQMIPAKVVWVDRAGSLGYLVAGVEFSANISAHLDAA
jgi:hypothetical protein